MTDVVFFNCILEHIVEDQDGVVGRRLREVNGGWRGRIGIAAV